MTRKDAKRVTPCLILFDADGTLYQSHRLHYLAYEHALRNMKCSKKIQWKDFKREVIDGAKNGPLFLGEQGIQIDAAVFYKKRQEAYEQLAHENLQATDGAKEFLQWCRDNDIQLGIVSASKLSVIKTSLSLLDLADHFELIVSYEDTIGHQKPDPFPYVLARERTKTSPEDVLVFEDSHKGVQAAKAAGLRCIGLLHNTNTKQSLQNADHIITSFREANKYVSSAEG